MRRDLEPDLIGENISARRSAEDTGPSDERSSFSPGTLAEAILGLQRGAGNAAVARMLARQPTDTGNDRPAVAKEQVKRIVGEQHGLDDILLEWSYGKAEAYLTNFYKGRAKGPSFSAAKVWKKPSEWGELDMDVPFKLIKFPESTGDLGQDLENLEKAREGVEERHIKLQGSFTQSMESGSGLFGFFTRSDDLSLTLDAVEWWEGHAIVVRSWQARVRIEGRAFPGIQELGEQERGQAPSGDPKPGKGKAG